MIFFMLELNLPYRCDFPTCAWLIFRKFKSLGSSGFSLRKHDNYMPFQCTFIQKRMVSSELKRMGTYPSWYESTSTSANSGSPDACQMLSESSSTNSSGEKGKTTEERQLYTIMYCVPLMSPYSGNNLQYNSKTTHCYKKNLEYGSSVL